MSKPNDKDKALVRAILSESPTLTSDHQAVALYREEREREERIRVAQQIKRLYAGRSTVPWKELYDLVLELQSLETN